MIYIDEMWDIIVNSLNHSWRVYHNNGNIVIVLLRNMSTNLNNWFRNETLRHLLEVFHFTLAWEIVFLLGLHMYTLFGAVKLPQSELSSKAPCSIETVRKSIGTTVVLRFSLNAWIFNVFWIYAKIYIFKSENC